MIYQIRSKLGIFWSKSLLGLIEGIYEHETLNARRILREWIECSREPTFLEKEITKVAAKRIRQNSELKADGRELRRPPFPLPEAQTEISRSRSETDREVQAELFARDGSLLFKSKNTNGKIRTRHAEMNLIDEYGKTFPRGSKLVVSLKPCRMCAARIWENAELIEDFKVVYRENDPGPHAQETLLDPKSAARLRAFGKESPWFSIEIQSQA